MSFHAKTWVLIASVLFTAPGANAALVTLSFDGTYDTSGNTIFGLSGSAVPYSFQITYDTTLDTNPEYFATGDSLAGLTTTHEWYGYSLSGVTATKLTFGTKTWSSSDIYTAGSPSPGVPADLWFDTDISITAPTRSYVAISSLDGLLSLGYVKTDASSIWMAQESQIGESVGGGSFRIIYLGNSTSMNISSVPIPAAAWLFGSALLGLIGISRRKVAS